jgi:hypothetical protein
MITFAQSESHDYKRWTINESIVILYLTFEGEKRLEILQRSSFADLRDLPIYYQKDFRDLISSIFKAEAIVKKI